jgi:hypothetical protein
MGKLIGLSRSSKACQNCLLILAFNTIAEQMVAFFTVTAIGAGDIYQNELKKHLRAIIGLEHAKYFMGPVLPLGAMSVPKVNSTPELALTDNGNEPL